jgi:hypothetical protein
MLLDDSEFTIHPKKEEYLANAKSNANPKFKYSEYFSEITFMPDEYENDFGNVYIFVNKTAYPWVDPVQSFWMKNTNKGWQIVLTPNH